MIWCMSKPLPQVSCASASKEMAVFLRRWLSHPWRMGCLWPSSKILARRMAQAALAELAQGELVLELGGGTGRLTQALLDCGVPSDRIVCIELDAKLADYLRERFPGIHVLQGNACFLNTLIPGAWQGKIGVVLSGLPMLNFSALMQQQIVQGCFDVLKPEGAIVQLTYGLGVSIKAPVQGLTSQRLGFVWQNMPPAHVWAYRLAKDS